MTEQDIDLIRGLLVMNMMNLRAMHKVTPTPEIAEDIADHQRTLYNLEKAALAA